MAHPYQARRNRNQQNNSRDEANTTPASGLTPAEDKAFNEIVDHVTRLERNIEELAHANNELSRRISDLAALIKSRGIVDNR